MPAAIHPFRWHGKRDREPTKRIIQALHIFGLASRMHGMPTINPVAIRHTVEELRHRGQSPEPLCRGMGITVDAFDAPDFRLSCRQAGTLASRALRLIPDPCLGHDVGRRRTLVSSGLFGLAIATSASLEQMVELFSRHQGALGAALTLRCEWGQQGSRSLIAEADHPEPSVTAFFLDELFAATVQLIRGALGPSFTPQAVELTHARPAHEQTLHGFFRSPVGFMRTANRLVINTEWLHTKVPSADPVVHRQVMAMLDRELAEQDTSDICLTIEHMLRARLHSPPKLDELANSLSTSERTLRRKLAEQGTSYQALTDKVCQSKAVELLQSSKTPVSEIAAALGFSDVRNFRRAFKRWTGLAPTSFRK